MHEVLQPQSDAKIPGIDYEITSSHDGKTLWIAGADGSCIARFSKRFGIDIHRSAAEQMNGAGECLYCTHQPAGQAEWAFFRTSVQAHFKIDVPESSMRF